MSAILIIEILGFLLLVACLVFYFFYPVRRDRFLFGNKSWLGSLVFCCVLVMGLVLSISLTNHVGYILKTGHSIGDYIVPKNLVNWDTAPALEGYSIKESQVDSTRVLEFQYQEPSAAKIDSAFAENNFYAIISQFADPGNIPSAQGKDRKFALILALLGIFCLSGLVMSSFVTLLTKKSDKWKDGLIHYNKFFNKYVVIIGVNEQTATIAKQSLARKGVKYVLIQTRQSVEQARERLDLNLDRSEENRVVFYYAERTSKEDIAALHLEKAVEVYVLGEDMNCENEEDHDAFNVNCLEHISTYIQDVNDRMLESGHGALPRRLKCHMSFEYQSTFTAFKSAHIYQSLDKILEFIPFNVHEIWSKKVLVDNYAIVPKEKKGESDVQRYYPIDSYIGKDGKRHGITKDNVGENAKSVHVVVLGMNQMGTSFALQAAVQAHFPNFMNHPELKTTITFIDDHAVAEGEFFKGRFEHLFGLCRSRTIVCGKDELDYSKNEESFNTEENDPLIKDSQFHYLNEGYGNFMDIQWEFIQGNVASDTVKNYLKDIVSDTKKTVTIAICFNHPQRSIASALYLPGLVFRRANQVLVYQRNSFDMLNKVAEGETDWKRYSNLFPFGMIEGSYTGDTLENTAAAIQNYIFSKSFNGKDDTGASVLERLRQFDSTVIPEVEKAWAALGLGDKQSNIDMVEHVSTKIRSMGIQYVGEPRDITKVLEDKDLVEALAYSEHMRWVTERLVTGYRPLLKLELDEIEAGRKTKDFYKKHHRAHLDICSNERLKVVDPHSPENDFKVIRNIPLLLECTEWMNAVKITRVGFRDKENVLRAFLLHDGNKLSFRYVGNGSVAKYLYDSKKDKTVPDNLECNHSYWMADSPVTRLQWYLVTGKNKPKRREKDLPAVEISKNDIEDFLLILRKKTGLYFALPSLEEWEYAARRSTGYLADINESQWSRVLRFSKKGTSSPVKARALCKRQKNDLGIYDMLGNVWEWTREEVKDHKNCFYFCGGSWRFKQKECNMGDKENGDLEYWYSYWSPILASDDIGCRLIWKFNIDSSHAKAISTTITKSKEPESDRNALLKEWFELHPMVDVEEGFFVQGTETNGTRDESFPEKWVDDNAGIDETPHHVVKISAFKVGSIPVTQELWNIVMGTDSKTNPASIIGNDYPQTNISYRDIKNEFLPAINKIMKDELNGEEYRLLSESEWEYVAKGAHTSPVCKALKAEYNQEKNLKNVDSILAGLERYPLYAGSNEPDEVAWFDQNCLQPVAKKKPISEEFKVFDMSGNIWEWVDDFYQTDYYNDCMRMQEYKDTGIVTDPICTDPEYSAHVFRGGSWLFGKEDSRCTRPNYWVDTDTDDDLGFRLVRGPKRAKDKTIKI